jgi:hypothetical protein
VTGGRAADRASLRHRSSLVFVLSVVWGNRQLRRVELAFATFSAGKWPCFSKPSPEDRDQGFVIPVAGGLVHVQ